MSTTPTATPSGSATLTGTLASSLASSLSTALSTTLSATLSSNGTITSTSSASPTSDTASATTSALNVAGSEKYQGITLVAFLTALATGLVVFAIQILAFLLLRNKIARIFKPKTYLVPERERTESPPSAPWSLISTLVKYNDREIIKKCGLDAYFFLRYLRTLLTIFIPIAAIVIPILTPLNYSDGQGHDLVDEAKNDTTNGTSSSSVRLMARANNDATTVPTGLDTLAWGNVGKNHTGRYWAHLILALLVIIWVCTVFFFELRVYVKVRQDYLTSAEHRLRASATTILVNSIPSKWLTEEALGGLFDVFPGQIRNIWLNRDLTPLLEKIQQREDIHLKLESAETDLVKAAKKKQLKRKKQEEKAARKASKSKGPSRQEQALRRQAEDAEAKKRAEAGQGVSSGEHDEVPHDISAVINENRDDAKSRRSSTSSSSSSEDGNRPQSKGFGLGFIGDGVTKVGKGLLGGLGKAQKEIKEFTEDVDDTVETTNGFAMLHPDNRPRKVQILADSDRPATPKSTKDTTEQVEPLANTETHKTHSRNVSAVSQETADPNYKRSYEPFGNGNTVRKVSNLDHMYDQETRKFWQFWKAPAGGYASPVPQGFDGGEYPFNQKKDKTLWQNIKSYIPFMGDDDQIPVDYPEWNAVGGEYKNILDDDAEWRKWVKEKDRPTHRLPRWGFPNWLAWLTFGPKVDTIYWCRSELARLNVEIEDDQAHPERYPLMNSAFIQFNHQVSAHMACQSLMHHIPKHMSPRINEVSPKDVIWDNMAMKWWHESIRSGTVTIIIAAMAFFWAIPIAFTASIANIDGLVERFPWLDWIKKAPIDKVASAVAGVLPAILLALLLFIVPHILEQLALFRGVKTGSQKEEFVQRFYFVFLFIQVFLVVSIASFFTASAEKLAQNFEGLTNVTNILDLLADNLPRASNYFFSYMLLQALSVSSGTLLQIGAVLVWYILARVLDSTARDKWKRNTTLSKIAWGQFFPVYTNFACIALVYCVVAPLISLFAVLTFGLLWFAQRYSMLYVTRFENDTGGVLYPRAINQTFTGLYVMEACLAGLFFIVQDEHDNNTAVPQGVIMLITIGFTAVYQVSLNTSFSPLFRYLPITVEDEAVIRDEAFQRAQNKRLGLGDDDDDEDDEKTPMRNGDGAGSVNRDIEMQTMSNGTPKRKPSTMRKVKDVGHWAKREGKNLRSKTWKMGPAPVHPAAEYRRQQRNKDLEAQRALGEALYGGFHDEIEDLTPDERDALVKNAFKHYALRARAPAVWLPRDDIGVCDDEIRRTKEYSEHIWISNEGTALDSKVRVVYGANPPDFSEIDIINL